MPNNDKLGVGVFSKLRVDENTTLLDAINQEKMVESSSLH